MAPDRVTLLVREQCSLCEDARQALTRVSSRTGLVWSERDVTADPDDLDAYGDRVPVVLLDGVEHGYWRVEEQRLERALARRPT